MRVLAPIAGDIRVKNHKTNNGVLLTTNATFNGVANVEVEGKLSLKDGTKRDFVFEITKWKDSLDDLAIHPTLKGDFNGKAKEAANKAFADQSEKLKATIKHMLTASAAKGQIRFLS